MRFDAVIQGTPHPGSHQVGTGDYADLCGSHVALFHLYESCLSMRLIAGYSPGNYPFGVSLNHGNPDPRLINSLAS